MSSDVVFAVAARMRRFRWSGLAVAAALVLVALAPLTGSAASAAGTASTLCAGYAGCTQGQFSTHGYQNASGQSFWEMYAGNNCTNYVAYVESSTYEVPTPGYDLGDGGQWAAAASEHGVVVNHTPTVGAVAEWDGGASGMPESGHVAVVEEVGPADSYIVISQQHMIGPDGYDWVRIKRNSAENQWEDWPSNFIHFSIPATAPGEIALNSSKVLVRVTPHRFAGYRFDFQDQTNWIVKSGTVSPLLDGSYHVALRNPALRSHFALSVRVTGRSVRLLPRGSMLESLAVPGFELTRDASRARVVVTISIRRLTTTSITTTTTPTTTTTTLLPVISPSPLAGL